MSLDLHTGQPVWLIDKKETFLHQALTEDLRTEVVVIGGGIAGALISHALIQKGMEVVLLDAGEIAAGSTSASTAILSYETDDHLAKLINKLGERSAVRVFQAGIEAIDTIEKAVRELDDPCDFKRRDSIYYASTTEDVEIIRKEYQLRKKHGFDVQFLSQTKIETTYSFTAPGALLTPNAAEIDPVKFTLALVRAAKKKGLRVFTGTKIEKYIPHKTEPQAITTKGLVVNANCFVFATGYETQEFLHQKSVKLLSTYAIASEPFKHLPDSLKRSVLWESNRPYLYIRTTADDRILVGGEDVDFKNEKKRDALLGSKAKILEKKFKQLFPQIPFELASAWTGTFAESEDSLPYVGIHKDFPGAFFSLGYGGNGSTFAAMACGIISDIIEGKENSDAEIFSFER
ncbi:MAG: NAD(P)/FAD-dependent oxidoreductase [Bacteroidia bacterium]